MSIRNTMLMMTVMVILLGAGMLIALTYSINVVTDLKEQRVTLSDIHSDILMLRRNEKDFLMRNDLKYQEKFKKNSQNLLSRIDSFQAHLNEYDMKIEEINQLETAVKGYQDKFTQLVYLSVRVGLDEKSGLQGELRGAVHDIESYLKQYKNDSLFKDMLMLRRREKDFLLRFNLKYLDKFDKDIITFANNLENSDIDLNGQQRIKTLLSTYQNKFHNMVKGYEQKGLDSNSGVLGDMRKTIHQTDQALASMDEKAEQFLLQKIDQITTTIYTLAILLVIMISLISLRLIKRISSAVSAFTKTIKSVESSSDFSSRFVYQNQDEILEIGNAFNSLLTKIQTSIGEANGVLQSVADGVFDQRMTAETQGDLLTLKEGVNNSAQSVEFMMSELAKVMDGLYQGDFSVKMDKRVAGEFRKRTDDALHAMDDTIQDIVSVMRKMEHGDFDSRVSVAARGDLQNLKNSVNNSMDALENAISDITSVIVAQSEGDLTKKITNNYHGELEKVKKAINATAEKLVDVVASANLASNVVNASSQEVTRGALDLSQRVQEQAASLEETAATMDEMNAQVHSNTQHAHDAAKVAEEVQLKANQGTGVMEQTIAAMSTIEESSHKISEIVALIDSIAFQTNLLALNAAVEAARAGEHGRGFAVVAGEVRSLAQKSADAAKDIKNLIEETVERVNHGSALATESGEMLETINNDIKSVTDMVFKIAEASAEQAKGIVQTHKAIDQIDKVTQQNAALVEQTSASAEEMTKQAEELSNNMAFFAVGQTQFVTSIENKASERSITPIMVEDVREPSTENKVNDESRHPENSVKPGSNQKIGKPVSEAEAVMKAADNDGEWNEF